MRAGPPGRGIAVATSRPRSDVYLVTLTGELDMATAPVVRDHLRRVATTRPAALVIDLTAVTFLGGAGLALLVEARHATHGGLQVVAAPDGPVRRALRLTRVDTLLPLHTRVADALAAADALRN